MTKPSKEKVIRENQYNGIAWAYDFLAALVFRNKIAKSQECFLCDIPDGSTVLFLGGGSNGTLKRLLDHKPSIQVDFVEASEAMLQRARNKIPLHQRKGVRFIHGTESKAENKQFDCILCFYFLDLFPMPNMKQIIQSLHLNLKPQGSLLIADFKPAEKFWQKWVEKSMFQFLKYTTKIASHRIEDIDGALQDEYFSRAAYQTFFGDYIFSATYRLKTRNNICSKPQ